MKDTYAVIDKNGIVVNVVLWDGVAKWNPPTGMTAALADDECRIGGAYINGRFTPPNDKEL